MLCQNCQKEIGNRAECNFCGFNYAKDVLGVVDPESTPVLPPVKKEYPKQANSMATLGFVLGLFSWMFPCGIIGFICSIIGMHRAKYYHSGRILSFLGFLMNSAIGVLFIIALVLSIMESGGM